MEWFSSTISLWALKEKKIRIEEKLPYLISEGQISESTIIQKIYKNYLPVRWFQWICKENRACSRCPRICHGHLGIG
jgi:hypothetical protein